MRRLALLPAALLLGCPEPDPSGSTGADASTSSASSTGSDTASASASSTASTTGPEPTTSTTGGSTTAASTDPFTTTNGGPGPKLDCAGIPTGTVGVPYLATLTADSPATNFTWQFGFQQPPAWLKLQPQADSHFADLTGTPDKAGTFMFQVEVFSNESEEGGQASCTLEIAAAAAPVGPVR